MKKRILIVDDSKTLRDQLEEILIQLGYDIAGHADNGAAAIRLVKELKPDIVTLDRIMPKMDGIETLRMIKKLDPTVTVIMVTARSDKASVLECAKAGAAHYILKPFEHDRVASVMEKLSSVPGSA